MRVLLVLDLPTDIKLHLIAPISGYHVEDPCPAANPRRLVVMTLLILFIGAGFIIPLRNSSLIYSCFPAISLSISSFIWNWTCLLCISSSDMSRRSLWSCSTSGLLIFLLLSGYHAFFFANDCGIWSSVVCCFSKELFQISKHQSMILGRSLRKVFVVGGELSGMPTI